jgi:hypothetical protein
MQEMDKEKSNFSPIIINLLSFELNKRLISFLFYELLF